MITIRDWNSTSCATHSYMFGAGVVLFSPWRPQVSPGDQNGPSEDGKKTSNASRDCEPSSRWYYWSIETTSDRDDLVQAWMILIKCLFMHPLLSSLTERENWLELLLYYFSRYFLPGVAEQSVVDQVDTTKPVLKMALCSSFTDTSNELKT